MAAALERGVAKLGSVMARLLEDSVWSGCWSPALLCRRAPCRASRIWPTSKACAKISSSATAWWLASTEPATPSTMPCSPSNRCRRCWNGSAVNIRTATTLRTGNIAAVMVTANLLPFGTQGTRIDVTVSARWRCQEPAGRHAPGHPAPLGADGNVYAVGQGSLAIGGFQAEGDVPPRSRAAFRPSAGSPTAPSSSARSTSPSTG